MILGALRRAHRLVLFCCCDPVEDKRGLPVGKEGPRPGLDLNQEPKVVQGSDQVLPVDVVEEALDVEKEDCALLLACEGELSVMKEL